MSSREKRPLTQRPFQEALSGVVLPRGMRPLREAREGAQRQKPAHCGDNKSGRKERRPHNSNQLSGKEMSNQNQTATPLHTPAATATASEEGAPKPSPWPTMREVTSFTTKTAIGATAAVAAGTALLAIGKRMYAPAAPGEPEEG